MTVNNKQLIFFSIYLTFMLSVVALVLINKFISPYALIHTSEIRIKSHASSETAHFAPIPSLFIYSSTNPSSHSEMPITANSAQTNPGHESHIPVNTNGSLKSHISHYTKLDLPITEETYGFIDSKGVLQIRILENNSSRDLAIIRKARFCQQNSLISVLPSSSPTPVDTSQEDFGHIIPEKCSDIPYVSLSPVYGQTGLYYSIDASNKPVYYLYGCYPNTKPAFYPCDAFGQFIKGSFPVVLR